MEKSIQQIIIEKTGDAQPTVANYLRGHRGISKERAKKWGKCLDIDPAVLLLESPEMVMSLIRERQEIRQ